MTDLLLGLDIGTSSLKALVIDRDGTVHQRFTEHYVTHSTATGYAEQDPEDWLRALDRVMSGMPQVLRARIGAVGVDGHVPSLVAVDVKGQAVHSCLTWQDTRAEAEARHLADRLGDAERHFGTNLPWSPSQLTAKAAWLAQHCPDAAAKTAYLLQPKDFLNLHLTGVAAGDVWGSKGLAHVVTRAAAGEVFDAIGMSPAVLPPSLDPWSPLAELSASASQRWDLPAGIPVAVGWTDALASILAAGCFDHPGAVVLTGTSEIVGASALQATTVDGLYLVPEGIAPLALSYGPTQSSGAALLWISETLGLEVGAALGLAATAGEPPMFTPYIDGERAPLWDPDVRGLFLGLNRSHGPGELVRAVVEGIALSSADVLVRAQSGTGTPIESVNVGGRGVDHPAWLAARGTALGSRLRLHQEPHLAALGAAMLAALAAGAEISDLDAMRGPAIYHSPSSAELRRGTRLRDRYLAASEISQEWTTS